MAGDPYLDLRKRVQHRMEARLALAEGEINTERSLRQIELASGLARGQADDRAKVLDILEEKFEEALQHERVRLSQYEQRRLFGLIVGDILGLGPLDALLEDPAVTAAYVLDTRAIYVERGGKVTRAQAAFDDVQQLNKVARRIFEPLGYWVGGSTALAAGHLSDGVQVEAALSPGISPDGAQLIIRKPPTAPPTLSTLVKTGALPEAVADFLQAGLLARRNILIVGPPRSGKAQFLAALANSLPGEARLVVVERASGMAISHEHTARLEASPQHGAAYSAEALLRRAPDLLPDWVWLDEVTAEVAAAYVEMLSRMGLCSTLTLRSPGGPSSMGTGPLRALDRLVALALQTMPSLPAAVVEDQIAAGLEVLVYLERDAQGMSRVDAVALFAREGPGWRVQSIYRAHEGSIDTLVMATDALLADAAPFMGQRATPTGGPGALSQTVFAEDGSLADATLDEVHIVGAHAIGLREADGAPFSAELSDPAGEIERLTRAVESEALLWASERADRTQLALARPPVSVDGAAVSVERFSAQPGGLKRLADLGMLTPESGGFLVQSAGKAKQSVLLCGPRGSGKRAVIHGLLQVLPDAPDWQVIDRLGAQTLPELLSSAGQAKTLASVDCADGVDPFAALRVWYALWSGQGQPVIPSRLAGAFSLLVRMGRVGGRQRMILSIEEILTAGDAYRLEPLFKAQQDESGKLILVRVGQPPF